MKKLLGLLIFVGLGALVQGCATPKEPTLVQKDVGQRMDLAHRAFGDRRYEMASRLYEEALAAARKANDRGLVAQCAYNLASVEYLAGNYARASSVLNEAVVNYEPAVPAAVWLLAGRLELVQGDGEKAAALADRSIAAGGNKDQASTVMAYLLKAQVYSNDLAMAWQAWNGAAGLKPEGEVLQAAVSSEEGVLREREGQYAEAAVAYGQGADLYRLAGRYAEMAADLAGYGRAMERQGKKSEAWEGYMAAARSYLAQGKYPEALFNIDATLRAGGELSEEKKKLAAELFEETKKAVAQKLQEEKYAFPK